jgi:hypothetical protein
MLGIDWKHIVPLTNVSVVDGNVALDQPVRYALQCCVPGETDGIIVPPVPINRIHLPPIVVLNSGPSSHAPPIPDFPTLRDGSLITV